MVWRDLKEMKDESGKIQQKKLGKYFSCSLISLHWKCNKSALPTKISMLKPTYYILQCRELLNC